MLVLALASVLGSMAAAPAWSASTPERTLELIRSWIQPGWYDNEAQVEQDLEKGVPDRLIHRPMHQFFAPVTVPGLEGFVVFQQASQDGSKTPESLFRTGLLHFFVDAELGVVRQRELNFKDGERFRNAHLQPELLAKVTPDDVRVDSKCDFLLRADDAGTEVRGPIVPKECRILSRGTNEWLWADDEVVIRPGEFWFLGRFKDEKGVVKWGNENDELNRLVHRPESAGEATDRR
jgi:hypothetical protein